MFGGALSEVTKGAALILLLGVFTVVPPRQRLLAVLMLPGRLTPEDGVLEVEVAAVEKVAEDCREGALSMLLCAWCARGQCCMRRGEAALVTGE